MTSQCVKFRLLVLVAFFALFWVTTAYAQQDYYLAHVVNGRFPAGSFRTTFVIFNNNDSSVFADIELTDDNGAPLIMPMAGQGFFGNRLWLEPGASRILTTDGSGDLIVGAAKVTAPARIGVSAIFSFFDTNGDFVTEAGLGSSEPLTEFVIPVDATDSFNTGVALSNIGNDDALIRLRLLDSAGQEIAVTFLPLDARAHVARFVAGQLFPNITDFRGTLSVSSSVPIAAIALRQNYFPLSYTSLPAVSRSSSKVEFNLPHVATGSFPEGSFGTEFLLFNISSTNATVNLSLTKDDGSPFIVTIPGRGTSADFTLTLGPRASTSLQTDHSGALASGSARITSNVPIGASLILSVSDAHGRFQTETGVGDSPVLTDLTVPVDSTGSFDTAVAFFNPATSPSALTLRLIDRNGMIAGTVTATLGERNHAARFVTQLFPGTANFRGSLSISSSEGIAAVALRQNRVPLSYTTLPAAGGTAEGTPPRLARTRARVSASSDVVINEALPTGFRLSGTISGPGYAQRVLAQGNDGSIFTSYIDPETREYLIIVPAGTYRLTVYFTPDYAALTLGTIIATSFSDPALVQVAGNARRNITLPEVNVFNVSGTVSGLSNLPSFTYGWLGFTSTDSTSEGVSLLDSNGSYQGQLPNGTYTVRLLTENITIYNLGSVTVSGSQITANVTVPATARISGVVRGPGISRFLSGSLVIATDSSAPQLSMIASGFPLQSNYAELDRAGSYQLVLAANRTYNTRVAIALKEGINILGIVSFPASGSQVTLTGDTTQDFNLPALPGRVTISGQVTDSSGRGVPDVFVTATTREVTGAPSVEYFADTITDSNGTYRIVVLNGTNYQLLFEPRPSLRYVLPAW